MIFGAEQDYPSSFIRATQREESGACADVDDEMAPCDVSELRICAAGGLLEEISLLDRSLASARPLSRSAPSPSRLAMNVSIQTSMGLRVYRELIQNELSAPAKWEMNYGLHNQLKPIDRQKLVRVDGIEAANSLPMPLSVQLFHLQVRHTALLPHALRQQPLSKLAFCSFLWPHPFDSRLQRERIKATREAKEWEAGALPKFSRHPISKTSVDIFGEETAHAQRPHAERRERPVSAPVTFSQGPPHRHARATLEGRSYAPAARATVVPCMPPPAL